MADLDIPAMKQSLGIQLRFERQRRGMTLGEAVTRLAEVSGEVIGDQTLASYETGDRSINVVRLVHLADVYDVAVRQIVAPALRRIGYTPVCRGCGRP